MKIARIVAALGGALLICLGAGPALAQSPHPVPSPGPVPGGPFPGGHPTDLVIRKTAVGPAFGVGLAANFQILVTNAGPSSVGGAQGVFVTDTLPAAFGGLVLASGTGWTCSVSGLTVTCHYVGAPVGPGGNLPPISVTATAMKQGAYSNCASVAMTSGVDLKPGNNRGCVDGAIRPGIERFDLTIRKLGGGVAAVGQTVTFNLAPGNLVGGSTITGASGVVVTDTLPAGLSAPITATGAGWNCSVTGQTVSCLYVGPPMILAGSNLAIITVTAKARVAGRYSNCADIRARGQDLRPGDNRGCVQGEIQGGPTSFDVGVRKTGPGPLTAGQTASFTLSPFNTGPSPVSGSSGVVVTDTLPANFVGPVSATGLGWTCTVSGSGPYLITCAYVGPPVPAGGVMPPITVTAVAKGTGGYVNCASIAVKAGQDVKPGDNRGCVGGEIRPADKGYDVAIRKTGPGPLVVGQSATFTLAPFNNGPSTVNSASGVVVTDTLPSNFSPPMTVTMGPGWACSFTNTGLTLSCHYTGPAVGPGQPLPPITVTAAASGAGGYVNCASISLTAGPDLKPGDNRGCVEGGVQQGHKKQDLAFTKTAVSAPWINPGVGQFHMVASNVGNTTFPTGQVLHIKDFLPEGMGFVTASAPWSCTTSPGPGGTTLVDCQMALTGPLAPGQTVALNMNVLVSGPPRESYQNCAGVAATAGGGSVALPEISFDNNNACATVVARPQVIDLGIRKTGPGPLTLGQTATFVLHPVNNAATPLPAGAGVVVTDTLPASFSPPVTASGGPDWTCTVTGLSVSCAYMGSMPTPAGQPLPPITITAVAGKPGSFQNCARVEVKIDFPDAHPADNQDCVPVVITAPYPFDLGIRKTGPGSLFVGQTGTFVLTPFNNASTPLALQTPQQVPLMSMSGFVVEVTDTLPSTFTPPVTVNGGPDWNCTVTGLTLWCTYTGTAVFGPGQPLPAITVTAVAGQTGAIQNCASVNATLMGWQIDLNQSNNKACVPVVVGPAGKYDVGIRKTGPGPLSVGQTGTFTLYPRNTGPSPVNSASGVIVTDILPPNFTTPVTANGGPNWTCTVTGLTVDCHYVGPAVGPNQPLPPITITAVASKPGEGKNCARIGLTAGPDVKPSDNNDCVPVIITPAGKYDVGIRKTGPGPLSVGQTGTFTLGMINIGPSPVSAASGVVVTDILPSNFTTPVTASGGPNWTCTVTGLTVECHYVGPAVGPGQPLPPITITAVASKPGEDKNCARIGLTAGPDVKPADNDSCIPVIITPGGKYDVAITKTGPGPLTVGQSGTFTLKPFNNGPSPVNAASGVTVTDTLPLNFSLPVSIVAPGWTCNTSGPSPTSVSCTYNGPAIGPNSPQPPIAITAASVSAGGYMNCADIALAAGADTSLANNHGCVEGGVQTVKQYNLSLDKQWLGSTWNSAGGVYRLLVKNVGPTILPIGTVLTITDNTPQGLRFLGVQAPYVCTPVGYVVPVTITCAYTLVAPLAVNGTLNLDLTMDYVGQIEASYVNCATLSASVAETTLADNHDCVTSQRPNYDLSIDKQMVPGPWTLASGGQFTLVITNNSAVPIPAGSSIHVTEHVPAGMILNAIPSPWTCYQLPVSGTQAQCDLPLSTALAPGQSITLTLTMAFVGPVQGHYENCAVIYGFVDGRQLMETNQFDNNQDCAVVPPPAATPPTLTITKTLVDDCYQNGNGNDTQCTFRIEVMNTGTVTSTGVIQVTDMVQPQNASFVTLVGGQPGGWTCTGGQPLTCTSNWPITLAPNYGSWFLLTLNIASPIIPTTNCASLTLPVAAGPSCIPFGGGSALPPSFEIEKVVDQDCTGSPPDTHCKFTVRVFNTGSTSYTGPLSFTDTVTSFGNPTGGVGLVAPFPPGWTCTGVQPLTCATGGVTLAAGSHVTVPLFIDINSAVPPSQNCASLTAPLAAGPSCVGMGNTHYDLKLDSNFLPVQGQPGVRELSYWIASTPQVVNGTQVILNGSLTPGTPFAPWVVTSPGWSCSGTWASFQCVTTVAPGSFTGAFLVLRLKTSYPPGASGTSITYVGTVLKTNNIDPNAANSTRSVTTTLP